MEQTTLRWWRCIRYMVAAGLVVGAVPPAAADWPPVLRDTAMALASQHMSVQPSAVVRCALELDCFPCPCPSWYVEMDTSDGPMDAYVDAVTGRVWGWRRYPTSHVQNADDHGPVLSIALAEAEKTARAEAGRAHAAIACGRWPMSLGSPAVGQFAYSFAWDPVLDPVSGALGPVEVGVEVDHRTGQVVALTDATDLRLLVATHPTIERTAILARARCHALLDPVRFPINRIALRVRIDTFGSQRLVWECLQIVHDYGLDGGLDFYGVVFDAHTGEPLYPIAPMGGSKRPVRKVEFPRRASVRLEPSGRPMTTDLAPPVLDASGLRLRAEHLRAVEGVRVDVTRQGVTVVARDRTITGSELGAQWRDYGWWVPLRRAAKALGWRVTWNDAKKEAVILTGQ